jgi:hypothetical protein
MVIMFRQHNALTRDTGTESLWLSLRCEIRSRATTPHRPRPFRTHAAARSQRRSQRHAPSAPSALQVPVIRKRCMLGYSVLHSIPQGRQPRGLASAYASYSWIALTFWALALPSSKT